jgi:tetratricopeptide (TPR) repeat protein
MKRPSPYEVLGVREDAPWREIAAAYRQKAQQYHPDKMAGLASEFQTLAEERMKEVNAAYSTLKRQERKESPDEERTAHSQQNSQTEPPLSEASSGSADAYFEQGQHCLDAQRYEEAIASLTRALQLQPNFTPAYLSLAIAYGSLLRRMEQIEALKQAIRLQPDFAWAHAFLGLAYVQIGETAAAAREYEILKTLDPTLAEKLPQSIREIRPSSSSLPVAPAREQQAVGRKAPIVSASMTILFLVFFIAVYLILSRDDRRSPSAREKELETPVIPAPSNPLVALGRQYVLEMIAYAETEGGVSNEKKLMEAKSRIDELRLAKPIASGQEKKVAELVSAGLARLREAQFAEAIRVFQEAARVAPDNNEILENLGDAYLRNGDLGEAQQTLLSVLVLVPGQAPAWVNLGQAYARLGNFPAAIACFANAYRFSSDREETRQVLRNLAEKEKTEAAVRETAAQALKLPFLHSIPSL